MTLTPLSTIRPVYEPWHTLSRAPAAGLPTSDLYDATRQLEPETPVALVKTYGNEMMLYNSPIRMPISLISEICAIQGTMSALNAPENRPYSAA